MENRNMEELLADMKKIETEIQETPVN